MTLDVKFSENTQSLPMEMSAKGSTIATDFGEKVVVHNGMNGATFYPYVSEDGVISWTNDRELENPPSVNIKGKDGAKGDKGDRGEQGIRGEKGDKGDKGTDGKDGVNGRDGYTPIKGVDYFDGSNGKDGINGKDGKNGADGKDGKDGATGPQGEPGKNGVDGHTPIKGTDYFTEADKNEMVRAVISALPVYGGEVESV